MKKLFVAFLAVTFISFWPLVSNAGSLSILPIKVFLNKETKTATLDITNLSDEVMSIQVEGFKWWQDNNGQDKYEVTNEIVYFPKIFKIKPQEKKIVRVGYKGGWPQTEKTFRIYVRQLPIAKPSGKAVRMVLNIGVPVFVEPVSKTNGKILIEKVGMSGGRLFAAVKNPGNSFISVSKLIAKGVDNEGTKVFSREASGWYVLAGVTKWFPVEVSPEECSKSREIKVTAKTEKGKAEKSLRITPSMCQQGE